MVLHDTCEIHVDWWLRFVVRCRQTLIRLNQTATNYYVGWRTHTTTTRRRLSLIVATNPTSRVWFGGWRQLAARFGRPKWFVLRRYQCNFWSRYVILFHFLEWLVYQSQCFLLSWMLTLLYIVFLQDRFDLLWSLRTVHLILCFCSWGSECRCLLFRSYVSVRLSFIDSVNQCSSWLIDILHHDDFTNLWVETFIAMCIHRFEISGRW